MDRVRASMTAEVLAKRPITHWRYHELLPIEPDASVFSWPVGGSPILESPRLAAWAGVGGLRLKDDSRNPTLSFKDRASSVGVLHALQQGSVRIACASTGNAASSLAGYAAMAQLPATIFIPERAPEAKVAQMHLYGADVRRVLGSYDQAYELCNQQCEAHGWYNRNCAINPYLIEGKKTCGLEIAEQTKSDPPDWVVVSVGDGCSIAGIAKGLWEMHELGFIERLPRILGVQAAGMDPLARAFESDELPAEFPGETLADSIDVPTPRNWRKAVQRVRQLQGTFVRVADEDILDAMRACGSQADLPVLVEDKNLLESLRGPVVAPVPDSAHGLETNKRIRILYDHLEQGVQGLRLSVRFDGLHSGKANCFVFRLQVLQQGFGVG